MTELVALADVNDALNWLNEHPWAPWIVVAVLGVAWFAGRNSK